MSFTAGNHTSMQNLFDQIAGFLTADGWTDRALSPAAGRKGFSKTAGSQTVEVQFRWDTATPEYVGVYQSLGFAGAGVDPGMQTDDSGQGEVSGDNAVLVNGRSAQLNDTAGNHYLFSDGLEATFVVERSPGEHVVFGMGDLEHLGGSDWVGGEFAYGWVFDRLNPTSNSAVSQFSTMLLDGLAVEGVSSIRPFVATMHVEGLPAMAGASKWAMVWADAGTQGNDRGGNARVFVHGGYRGGPDARPMGRPSYSITTALLGMYPIKLFYREGTVVRELGMMRNIRGINIQTYEPGQLINDGVNNWQVFPSYRKDALPGTRFQGFAVKQVP